LFNKKYDLGGCVLNTTTPVLKIEEPARFSGVGDEIDLLELLRSIGRVWKQWAVSLVLVTLMFVSVQISRYLAVDTQNSYEIAIQFTFPGVEKSEYPNGSPFQLEEVIAPAVVSEVFDTNELADYGFSVERLRESLKVEPYAPSYALIVHKYKSQMSKNLSATEIQSLQTKMAGELNLATSGAALISLIAAKDEVPEVVLDKVLSDLPATWAKRAINDRGVLDLNIQLASSNSLNGELIGDIDYLIISDVLKEKVGLVMGNIEKLSKFDGVATISDSITGVRLADLQVKVNDLQSYVIEELMSPIRYLGLTKNRERSLFYSQDKRDYLLRELKLQNAQAVLVKETLENYSLKKNSSVKAPLPLNKGDFSALPDVDVFDRILALSSDGKIEAFRQSLSRQWLDLNIAAAELEIRVAEIDRAISILRGSNELRIEVGEQVDVKSLKERHIERIKNKLPSVLSQIGEYLDVTQRIYKQLSLENVGATGLLYRPITSEPFQKPALTDFKHQSLVLVAILFLTTVVVVPLLMIRNAMKR
jgi:hypothetical protein